MKQKSEFTVFVSCPSDVDPERACVEEVIDAINTSVFADSKGIRCRTITWKRDVASSIARSPQSTIDEQVTDYDIYLGIMAKRFGTPTEAAGGGTEHEFNAALADQGNGGRPWIMFFFRNSVALSMQELADARIREQVDRVIQFRQRVEALGIAKSYDDLPGFRESVRRDLENVLSQLSSPRAKGAEPDPDDTQILKQFHDAAQSFTGRFGGSSTNARYVEVDSRDAEGNPRGLLINALSYIVTTQNKPALVLGEFGSGKTTFALHYVHTLAERWLRDPDRETLPIFLRLREYRDAVPVEDWISDQMAKKLGIRLEPHSLPRFLRRQKLTVVFDGLDEVAGARDDHSIRMLIRELAKLVNMGMSVIVTCRTTFYESEVQGMIPFEKLYIDKLSHHQVIDCARKSLPDGWEPFVSSIQERFIYLSELAKRPLFLSMMIALQRSGTLYKIRNAGDLYSEITSAWIAKESLREGAMLNGRARREVVQSLAFEMLVRERGYFDQAELHEIIRELRERREVPGLEDFDVNQVIRDISNAAFMDLDPQNRFRFAHQSFMEFFVAEKFVRELLNNDTSSFGRRILYEEIYEHVSLLTDTTEKRRPLLSVLSNADANYVAKVNSIPPLRMQRNSEAIPSLIAALASDVNPLLRYVCGYTLGLFQEEYPDIFRQPDHRDFIHRAYLSERNSLIRCRLALLLSEGAYDSTWRELCPDFGFDEEGLEGLVSTPGLVAAYEKILKGRREHPVVIEESMRLLSVFVAKRRAASGDSAAVLTKYLFADGFGHKDERVRRMTIWVIIFLRLFEHHSLDGTQAHQIVSNALLDPALSVRTIARWANGVMAQATAENLASPRT